LLRQAPENRSSPRWTKPEIKIHIKSPEYMYLKFSTLLTPSVHKTVNLHEFKEV